MSNKPVERYVVPFVPDKELIDCLVKHGQPRRIAVTLRNSTQLRFMATLFYFDVDAAQAGDKEAKERVDFFRQSQQDLRKAERALGNDPEIGDPKARGSRIGMPEVVTRQKLREATAKRKRRIWTPPQ